MTGRAGPGGRTDGWQHYNFISFPRVDGAPWRAQQHSARIQSAKYEPLQWRWWHGYYSTQRCTGTRTLQYTLALTSTGLDILRERARMRVCIGIALIANT